MLVIAVRPYEPAAKSYGATTKSFTTADLGGVMKLFSDSGKPGMAYQYFVSDQDSSEPVVTYYSDKPDLADSLS